MPVHANSITAHHGNRYDQRCRDILAAYHKIARPATDREIMEAIGRQDMNAVRPRINGLRDMGVLVEMTPARCKVTGKTVRRCMPTGYQPDVAKAINDGMDLFANAVKPDYSQWGEKNGG